MQARVKDLLLEDGVYIRWPDYLYGSIKKKEKADVPRDYISAAKQHCGSKTFLKIDIENFFDNISEDAVFNVFRNLFKFPEKIANILTKITTYNGVLPQGAITSSHLASIVLYEVEPNIVQGLKYKNLTYTRYIDDITVSSPIHDYKMNGVLNLVRNKLLEKNLFVNEDKVFIGSHSLRSVMVHGLRVNAKEPTASKIFTSNVKEGVSKLVELSKRPNGITNAGYESLHRKMTGRASVLSRINNHSYKSIRRTLKKIRPKASFYDVGKLDFQVELLFKRSKHQRTSYWYSKNFFNSINSNAKVKRNFPRNAQKFSSVLKKIRPIGRN